jgi:hypothetical protein
MSSSTDCFILFQIVQLELKMETTKIGICTAAHFSYCQFHMIFVEHLPVEEKEIKFICFNFTFKSHVRLTQFIYFISRVQFIINEKLSHVCNIQTLRAVIIFIILHSLDNYGIIFWGKTISMYKIFLTPKNISRNMQGINSCSCRHWCEKLEILKMPRFYIYSSMLFVVDKFH